MDLEHKLHLIHQIHREQEENERYIYESLRIRNYDRSDSASDGYHRNYYQFRELGREEKPENWFGSLKLRILLSALLLLCFILMDRKGIVYKENGSKEVIEYISQNMDIQKLTSILQK